MFWPVGVVHVPLIPGRLVRPSTCCSCHLMSVMSFFIVLSGHMDVSCMDGAG